MDFPYNLRRFDPKDLHQVMDINRRCLPENYSESFFLSLHKNFPETFIVAEKDGMVVGYIMCRIESGLSGLGFTPLSFSKKGHIISIAVLPEHRRKGVGRSLMMRALNALREVYGCNSCFLEVRVSNSAAISLYRALGFKITKSIAGYYRDGEPAYVMELKF